MSIFKASLLALSLLALSSVSFAKSPPPKLVEAKPLGSPGDWVGTGDYPAMALRYKLTGITAFRLTYDEAGKPTRCDITESSGYDILDNATCRSLMSHAQFSPSIDRAGKSVGGTYTSRVRWTLPEGTETPVSERSGSMLLSVDPAGKVTSCKYEFNGIIAASAENAKLCEQMTQTPAAMGMELRGNYQGVSAEIELQQTDAFTEALRDRALAPRPGYEQRALNVFRFTVSKDGKMGRCDYTEQRGSDHQAHDFCIGARGTTFDPPLSAFNKDGVATGWHIVRVLLKN